MPASPSRSCILFPVTRVPPPAHHPAQALPEVPPPHLPMYWLAWSPRKAVSMAPEPPGQLPPTSQSCLRQVRDQAVLATPSPWRPPWTLEGCGHADHQAERCTEVWWPPPRSRQDGPQELIWRGFCSGTEAWRLPGAGPVDLPTRGSVRVPGHPCPRRSVQMLCEALCQGLPWSHCALTWNKSLDSSWDLL
uniref:Uncharacterized protein n=1 Tax=Pipistrellus kuhlii TaxID=59472 RepID=A0A7J7VBG8_PIPKU|nr:hypothetical protein mPipKuh1_008525 [Pipistrellus kuhlii]